MPARSRMLLLTASLLFAGCAETMPAEDQAQIDAQRIADVKQANTLPPAPVSPEKILYPDIETNNLFGTGCAFVPAGEGLGAVLLTQTNAAYLKLDEKIVRLAADKGGTEAPMGTWENYDGRAQAVELKFSGGDGRVSGSETVDYQAKLTIRNGRDQVLYETTGFAQCGS